jgi:hypothetical protein
LLAYRELDDALGPTVMAGEMLTDARTGNNRGARIASAVHINGNAVQSQDHRSGQEGDRRVLVLTTT